MNKASSNTWIQSSWHRTVTWVLFCGGLVLLAVLLWRMGPGTILTQLAAVGWKLPLVVLPYVFVAVFDALGWWYAFPQKPYPYGYFDLFRRRLAAKAINDVTPAFSMAGELAKVHVLQLRGIDGATAVASVVAAKTTLTLSELWFLFIALLLVPLKVPAAGVLFPEVWIGLLVAGLGIAGVILWQRNGLFCPFIDLYQRLGLPMRFIKRYLQVMESTDEKLGEYMRESRKDFWLSCVTHFIGWVAGGLEVWIILTCMGVQIDLGTAVVVEALLVIVQGVTGFVPGNIGTLEGGAVGIFLWIGLTPQSALAFMLLRRLRQVMWAGAGFAILGRLAHDEPAPPAESHPSMREDLNEGKESLY
ncbi:MAG: flippase-like domain-containing protein [Nitrospirae bacterium]|nr:MAG: flippase-like domain-containing protein [Nitrospirota bacterium]